MINRPLEHHIQRDIIVRLAKAESLRFSDLKPKDLENNTFMYHLKKVINNGMVEKIGDKYRLALAGLMYIDQLSYTNRRPRHQPKLLVILAIQNHKGEWLLARRIIQPYSGYSMLPSGKQHIGESPRVHAERELAEKTGLKTKLTPRGFINVQISKKVNLITHVAGLVFYGQVKKPKLIQTDDRFENCWQSEKMLEKIKLLPGTAEIIELIKQNPQQMFFESLNYFLS